MDEVGGEELCDRGAVASVQDRARLSSLVPASLLGEGDGDEALLVGRGRAPVSRLQPGEVGIVDERAEEKAGMAIRTEAAVAQMLLEGFGRTGNGYPRSRVAELPFTSNSDIHSDLAQHAAERPEVSWRGAWPQALSPDPLPILRPLLPFLRTLRAFGFLTKPLRGETSRAPQSLYPCGWLMS